MGTKGLWDSRPQRVLVTGSREWNHPTWIGRALAKLPRGSEVIHGGARGADTFAGIYARALGLKETVYPADWRGKGKRAGILRNLAMLDTHPDLVLAFWVDGSTGTKHTIDEARKRGITVHLITPELGEVGVVLCDCPDDDLDVVGVLEGALE